MIGDELVGLVAALVDALGLVVKAVDLVDAFELVVDTPSLLWTLWIS